MLEAAIAEIQKLANEIADMPGQETAAAHLRKRLGELSEKQAASTDKFFAQRD